MERELAGRGFARVRSDEPHEDHWILDRAPTGADVLAEVEDGGWAVSRTPRGDEPRGEWTTLGRGMDDPAALALIDRIVDGEDVRAEGTGR